MKEKISVFVDGFNLYHGICKLKKDFLKWLDLRLLGENFIDPTTQEIHQVFYFSAFATWRTDGGCDRHRTYVKALTTKNVRCIMGNFIKEERKCDACGDFDGHRKEKQSDTNLAIHLYREAIFEGYDHAILISADSDFVPAIKAVKEAKPNKNVLVLVPPKNDHPYHIAEIVGKDNVKEIKEEHLHKSQMSHFIPRTDKNDAIRRPKEYYPE